MDDGIKVLVTGGAGYVASSLLLRDDLRQSLSHSSNKTTKISRILLIDKLPLPRVFEAPEGIDVQYIQVDLTDVSQLNEVCKGVDVVYHLASYGMSGREQLHRDTIWKVNATGTNNVIDACLLNNVRALIFTSTVNVVFGGQRIEGGDETLPYYPPEKRSWDNYGNSKASAEQAVLLANGRITEDGRTALRTTALRLPGIYGMDERRHIPRVVGLMKQGLFKVTYGDNPVVEFIHVQNVTECLLLATRDLLQCKSKAAGEAYFISDGKPINNFEFFRPLTEALNISYPKISLPMWLVFSLAFVVEMVYRVVHKFYDFQPLLCRAEVYKTAQTHHFSIDKARRDLGYKPTNPNDMKDIAEHYRVDLPRVKHKSWTSLLVDISLVVIVVCVVMSFLPTAS